MLKDELEKILKKHALYEKGDPRGQKADLSGLDMSGLDMSGAKLSDADLFKAKLNNADLNWANLSGANLFWANLSNANLSNANLSDAILSFANLFKADLFRAKLIRANLSNADMSDAILSNANLSDANLINTNLSGAILRDANLSGAKLKWANFSGADLRGARLGHDLVIPVIERIDERILDALQQEEASLDMGAWHTCETAHCRAGWAIVLAGEAGKALQEKVGSCTAGALIYAASRPDKRVPNFFASNENAMASIRRDAETAKGLWDGRDCHEATA